MIITIFNILLSNRRWGQKVQLWLHADYAVLRIILITAKEHAPILVANIYKFPVPLWERQYLIK